MQKILFVSLMLSMPALMHAAAGSKEWHAKREAERAEKLQQDRQLALERGRALERQRAQDLATAMTARMAAQLKR